LFLKQKRNPEIQIAGDWGKNTCFFFFLRNRSDSSYKYYEADIKGMLDFLVYNIDVVFGDQVFQKSFAIPMGIHCATLLTDSFLYLYEAEFVQKLLRDIKEKKN
jgi:hypothetical protein